MTLDEADKQIGRIFRQTVDECLNRGTCADLAMGIQMEDGTSLTVNVHICCPELSGHEGGTVH